jgi:2-phospho-L-lactate guanylyltransferase
MTRSVWAVVPVKAFEHGKSRLSEVLAPEARVALTRRLFERARQAIAGAHGIERTLIATDSLEVAQQAQRHGFDSVLDGSERGLGPIIDQALAHAAAHGAAAALVVMGDLPQLESADLDAMLAALDTCDVVLAPDRESAGTNAMALRLPARAPTCFGHPNSYARHQSWCESLGLSTVTVLRTGLCFDLDTPADLADLK